MADDSTFKLVSDVAKPLNSPVLPPLRLTPREIQNLKVGDLVAAKIVFPVRVLDEPEHYHRARITEILKIRTEQGVDTKVQLFFVVCEGCGGHI